MLDAGIIPIAWFVIKVIIALGLVFVGGLFLFGLGKMLIGRSNGSIVKAILKVFIMLLIGGILGYYIGEMVCHFFGDGKHPVSGGVIGLLLLVIYGLGELIGDIYISVSIFAFIVWLGIMWSLGELLFPSTTEIQLSKKEVLEDDYNKKVGISLLKKIGIIVIVMFLYLMVGEYLHPNVPISKTQATIMIFLMFFGWLWINITTPKKPTEPETEDEKDMKERKKALTKLK